MSDKKIKKHSTKSKKSTKPKLKRTTKENSAASKNISNNNDTNLDDNKITNTEYELITSHVNDTEKNIFDYDNDVYFTTNIDYPKFLYGFQHFIHQSKDKMMITKNFEGKKKVYQVLNPFERYIDNYDNDIGKYSKKYFGLDKKPDILSRGFYKLWEILVLYDLIDVNNKDFVSAHLAEGPGSFIQATMFFREMFSKHWKQDKYYAVTLHSEDEGKHVPELEKNFVKYYDEEKPKRFILHKTYPKQVAGSSNNKDNGDITNPKTHILFGGLVKEKADLITADGGFEWDNENIQEQEAFRLIFGQIVGAILNQKKNGHFVCKFFETFTTTSLKFITILKTFYDKIDVIKPYTSRPSNSEKYYVCQNFKFDSDNKQYIAYTKKLMDMLATIHKEPKLKITDIMTDFNIDLDSNFLKPIIDTNIRIKNEQFKAINQIITFINEQNYYGDKYQTSRQNQINAANYWINTFFPNDYDTLLKNRKKLFN